MNPPIYATLSSTKNKTNKPSNQLYVNKERILMAALFLVVAALKGHKKLKTFYYTAVNKPEDSA